MRSVLVVLAVVVLAAGCSDVKPKPTPDISAERLGAPSPSLLRYLNDDERDALDRAGIGDRADATDATDDAAVGDGTDPGMDPDSDVSTSEKAGRVGVSLLSVGITLGALAAPFFLF